MKTAYSAESLMLLCTQWMTIVHCEWPDRKSNSHNIVKLLIHNLSGSHELHIALIISPKEKKKMDKCFSRVGCVEGEREETSMTEEFLWWRVSGLVRCGGRRPLSTQQMALIPTTLTTHTFPTAPTHISSISVAYNRDNFSIRYIIETNSVGATVWVGRRVDIWYYKRIFTLRRSCSYDIPLITLPLATLTI